MPAARPNQLILLVEDSAEDYEVIVRVFKKVNLTNPVHRCAEGETALDYLFRQGDFTNPSASPRPAIIILDLNLPGIDGREVLTRIKNNPELKSIPVIILTTSSHERDIQYCFQSGANCYLQKPVAMDQFILVAQRLKEFWFEVAILPTPDE